MKCHASRTAAISTLILLATIHAGRAGELPWGDHDEEELPFEEASIFFELNDTDGDLGIHALIDGEAWKELEIEAPSGRQLLYVRVIGRLQQQGLTELFLESAEPSFDELDPADFFRRFPAGAYEIGAITLAGDELESTAELTHVLPAPPDNIQVSGVPAAEDCDADPLPSLGAGEKVIISWDPVTRSHPGLGAVDPFIDIVGYQLVIEREEPALLVLSVDLPPDVTRLRVPSGFIAQGDAFKFEIAVREASGNQTVAESCFEIREG